LHDLFSRKGAEAQRNLFYGHGEGAIFLSRAAAVFGLADFIYK
jgi:hypothetical protein